jgi:hypothetical protein
MVAIKSVYHFLEIFRFTANHTTTKHIHALHSASKTRKEKNLMRW